jgi:hypothetical protein
MMPSEYQKFVVSIEATAQGPILLRMLHGGLGLATEWLEFVVEMNPGKRCEELGDVCYFATVIIDALGGELNPEVPVERVQDLVETICSEIKRRAFYDKQKLADEVLIRMCNQIVGAAQAEFGYVLILNTIKLKQRYPNGKFDAGDAMARADESLNPDGNRVV